MISTRSASSPSRSRRSNRPQRTQQGRRERSRRPLLWLLAGLDLGFAVEHRGDAADVEAAIADPAEAMREQAETRQGVDLALDRRLGLRHQPAEHEDIGG